MAVQHSAADLLPARQQFARLPFPANVRLLNVGPDRRHRVAGELLPDEPDPHRVPIPHDARVVTMALYHLDRIADILVLHPALARRVQPHGLAIVRRALYAPRPWTQADVHLHMWAPVRLRERLQRLKGVPAHLVFHVEALQTACSALQMIAHLSGCDEII